MRIELGDQWIIAIHGYPEGWSVSVEDDYETVQVSEGCSTQLIALLSALMYIKAKVTTEVVR